jgi:hypothetical protein
MTQRLNEVVTASAYNDRRRHESRTPCNREVALLPCASDDTNHFMRGRLSDCSPHGLGLVLNEKIEAGQQVLARIEIDRKPTLLMYTIRYCIPTKSDEYRAGARFTGFAGVKFRGTTESVVTALIEQG